MLLINMITLMKINVSLFFFKFVNLIGLKNNHKCIKEETICQKCSFGLAQISLAILVYCIKTL